MAAAGLPELDEVVARAGELLRIGPGIPKMGDGSV